MVRVIGWRVHLSACVLLAACAPSVPHAPELRAGTDAPADRLSTILETESGAGGGARDAAIKDSAVAPADAPIREAGPESSSSVDGGLARSDSARPRDTGPADQPTDGTDARQAGPLSADADADAHAHADVDADGWDASDGRDLAVADPPADAVPPPTDAQIVRPPRPGDLKISELLINPAGTDTNREWIEVVNRANDHVDLHQLAVADAAGEVAVDAGVLAPGAILVLGQSLDGARNGGAPVGVSFGNVISLNNGGDTIRLCLGSCAGGVVITEVSWPADLGAAFDGHAAVVGAVGGDGGDAIVFCPADQAFGTAGSFGRPGLADPACPG
jgi:Lamin Tail Domain